LTESGSEAKAILRDSFPKKDWITEDECKQFFKKYTGDLFRIPDKSFKDLFSTVKKHNPEQKGKRYVGKLRISGIQKWLEGIEKVPKEDDRFIFVKPMQPTPLSFDKGYSMKEPLLRVFRESLDREQWVEALKKDYGDKIRYTSFAKQVRNALAERFCRTSEKSIRDAWEMLFEDPENSGNECDVKDVVDALNDKKGELDKEYPCYPVAPIFLTQRRDQQARAEFDIINQLKNVAFIDITRYLLVAVAAFMLANALVVD